MINIEVDYNTFKEEILTKKLPLLRYNLGNITKLYAIDKVICFESTLDDDYLDDYNSNLKLLENKKLNETVSISPFADKTNLVFDGQGVEKLCPIGITSIDFKVLNLYKFDAVEIINCEINDRVKLQIVDDDLGSYSGVPSYVLNQFGTNWNLRDKEMIKTLPYEAKLYPNMIIRVLYENRTSEKTIYINLDLHKVIL